MAFKQLPPYVLRDLTVHPIPDALPPEDAANLFPPVFAQVVFQHPMCEAHAAEHTEAQAGERMWIQIMYVERKGGKITYGGPLCNEPNTFHPGHLRMGQIVEFNPQHVLQRYEGEPMPETPVVALRDVNSSPKETVRLLGVQAGVHGAH